MKLLFDIGNTNIKIGVIINDELKAVYRIKTADNKTADEYYMVIHKMFNGQAVEDAIIGSVVPNVTNAIIQMCEKHFHVTPKIIKPGIKTGVNIKTDNPREVGADLIAAAAGLEDEKMTLIIDLGTAIKYILVRERTIIGVIIAAGINLSLDALKGGTALLPQIDIQVPANVLGTNTVECMQSGITYGTAAQIDGLTKRISNEVMEPFSVVLTGGQSQLIAPLCQIENTVDPNLVIKGLHNILNKNTR